MLFSLPFRFAFYGLFRPLWRVFFLPLPLFARVRRRGRRHALAAQQAEKFVVGASDPFMLAIHIFLLNSPVYNRL
jgi:hypothetical protein